ncbi:unnamed protein product [Adineta steineri]|uniref:PRISE-like Rossmann-fold domain-containing protein n=1 Tax=Adineta steineri TaxID=433720 RepID=A0A818SGC6_9BILA|nr:unnamed protein product [Adineta steineri]
MKNVFKFITLHIVDEIVTELLKAGGQSITHVYHYTYIEKKDENELDEVNKILFQKALDVTVKIAGEQVKCVSLQTGYKYYGVHKGGEYLATRPYSENAPRHKGSNFYYTQEDLLKEYSKKHNWKYVITRPDIIVGVSKGNAMNFAVSLAIYASIQKEKGQSFIFPGNEIAWNSIVDHSDALNTARFQIWSSTNNKINNEIFNIYNGDEVKFSTLWASIEKYFGFTHHEQTFHTPKDIKIGDIGVLQFSLEKYVSENKDVWERLAKREKLDASAFDYATWGFVDFGLGRAFDDHGDMTNARQYGWTVTVDTTECYAQCFDRLKKLKIIPSD